jgi:quinolinate synthase
MTDHQSDLNVTELQNQIRHLAKQRNAVILAHNYQLPEVQDVANFVGDSLELSRKAAAINAEVIVFCGVHFMAETAKVLNPEKTVLLPDMTAGCSLADTINAEQLREWKKEHPGAVVVMYINTTAEVKAETDICCTSANAVKVVRSIPEDKEILFGPDLFLGSFVKRVTGRKNMYLWMGECHVHAGIRPEHINSARTAHPMADFLIHPECGCTTMALEYLANKDISEHNTYLLSTSQMLKHVQESVNDQFLIATETGMLHPLIKNNPEKTFHPISPEAVCEYMKAITLPKVLLSLQNDQYQITVPEEIASKARLSIQRMLEL